LHEYCHNNNIHSLVLQNGTVAAVDDGLAHLKRILDEHPQDATLQLLVDVRAGIPPLTYFLRELRRTYDGQPSMPPLRIVYIYHDDIITSALSGSFAALPVSATRRCIHNGTEQDAINWLIASNN
jgi:hypothetical protein